MDRSERFWDRQASSFDGQAESHDQTWLKTVENTKMHLNQSDFVLDYGCATGAIAFELASQVQEIHGIDISSKMIEAARKSATERHSENVSFTKATIFDERLQPESFTAILALNILHIPEDAELVVRRISELLEPGGLLISATACLGEGMPLLRMILYPLGKLGFVPSVRSFTISELEDLVAEGSFRIIETETLSRTPAINHFIVAEKH